MRLLDRFRRPDRVRGRNNEPREEEAKPLQKIEPPAATTGAAAQESLPNRASEEDAA